MVLLFKHKILGFDVTITVELEINATDKHQ